MKTPMDEMREIYQVFFAQEKDNINGLSQQEKDLYLVKLSTYTVWQYLNKVIPELEQKIENVIKLENENKAKVEKIMVDLLQQAYRSNV